MSQVSLVSQVAPVDVRCYQAAQTTKQTEYNDFTVIYVQSPDASEFSNVTNYIVTSCNKKLSRDENTRK